MRNKLIWGLIVLFLVSVIGFAPQISHQVSVASRVKQLFEQSYELGNLSPKTQQGIGDGKEPLATAKLKAQLQATYVTEEAQKNFDAILNMYRSDDGQAPDHRFDDVDFQILWWEGSSEDERRLVAKFIGIAKVTTNGQTRDVSCLGRYVVDLRKAEPRDEWFLSSWKLNEFSNCR